MKRALAIVALLVGTTAWADPPTAPAMQRAAAEGAAAAAPAPVSGPIAIELDCVRASNDGNTVDPQLDPQIVKHLRFTRYTAFELIDRHQASLSIDQSKTFDMEGNRRAKVDLVDADEAQAKLRIRIFNPDGTKLLDTTVSVHRNRSFMVAGPQLDDGVLIVPVTVRY